MGSMLRIESANLKPALHSLLMSDHARQHISIVLGSMFPNLHIAGNLKALLGIDLDSRGSKPNISPRKATRWAQDHSSSHSGQARVATWKVHCPGPAQNETQTSDGNTIRIATMARWNLHIAWVQAAMKMGSQAAMARPGVDHAGQLKRQMVRKRCHCSSVWESECCPSVVPNYIKQTHQPLWGDHE